jgi:uncharacterized protein YjlB
MITPGKRSEASAMKSDTMLFDVEARFKGVVQMCRVVHLVLKDDRTYPNNETLPLMVYPGALNPPEQDPASAFESLFSANDWRGSWRNGIYSFHHYHSTAHEVLGVFSGTAKVQLGGETGIVQALNPGDVVVIPAGVAHKNLGSSPDLGVVGAYPAGQHPDLCTGKKGERPEADRSIRRVSLPQRDPVYGRNGPLKTHWG